MSTYEAAKLNAAEEKAIAELATLEMDDRTLVLKLSLCCTIIGEHNAENMVDMTVNGAAGELPLPAEVVGMHKACQAEILRRLATVSGYHRRAQKAESERVQYENATKGIISLCLERIASYVESSHRHERLWRKAEIDVTSLRRELLKTTTRSLSWWDRLWE